jgi:hypothetical protein
MNPFFTDDVLRDSQRLPFVESLMAIEKMSTLEMGMIINHYVAKMPEDECYLNVGVYHGFTFFAGVVGNPDKKQIGVDHFRERGGKEAFYKNYPLFKGPLTKFYEMDFREYFKTHQGKIGVYFLDATHDFQTQYDGLVFAEPFWSDTIHILIDDANYDGAQEGTTKFLKEYPAYQKTFENSNFEKNFNSIYWNGLIVLERRPK